MYVSDMIANLMYTIHRIVVTVVSGVDGDFKKPHPVLFSIGAFFSFVLTISGG